jgi:hypothetical protein
MRFGLAKSSRAQTGQSDAIHSPDECASIVAIGPRDFIEEIWCRDLVDVTWNIFRYRRAKAACLAQQVSEAADKEASRRAEAAMRAMQDSDGDKIQQFLACDPRWNRAAAYPRAHQI